MPSIVDSLNLISKTMENILDFVAQDEVLSNDFQQYLEINNIEIETEREFNNVIIQYNGKEIIFKEHRTPVAPISLSNPVGDGTNETGVRGTSGQTTCGTTSQKELDLSEWITIGRNSNDIPRL